MLVVSDSVTALLPIFCTHEEEGGGMIFCTDLFDDKLHFGATIIVGGRHAVLSTIPTQPHGEGDLIGGTSIAII